MDDSTQIQAAILAGSAPFMGQDFYVERGVLVPRVVTEVLVRATCTLFRNGTPRRFVDLGCGCGMIGIMLARAFPDAQVMALDISTDAVRTTRRNIQKFGLMDRVEARRGDMFVPIGELEGQVDAIVSSPPFISSGRLANASAHLLEHEPREAFDAGPYGISVHQRLINEGVPLLRAGSGWMIVEFGDGQDRQVRRLAERSGHFGAIEEFREASGTFVACIAACRKAE
jgi:release factor glutamine methyltransferase